ncbi:MULTISPECIES: aldo/keto reductase [unclassified Caballeronia]|uniref:aldo/keto reductase n=1 Tax=unclassified Caballeronia TaxID=2646786 RepID=UPI002027EF31|nr:MULTISPECIES: aldo/keto reductase [unclassified Caballeronia]
MRFNLLGQTGVRVSQIALGTANFGTRWGHGADEAESATILDAYAAAGGNFIDTADVYQFGQSEEILGTLLDGRRDDFLLATKFTYGSTPEPNRLVTGNNRRAMATSVEASLKRLKTDRIDLLWVHNPDELTPTEEIVRGLDDLARAGKVLYAGLSNFPAWRLARAVTMAELTRAVPIAAAQFEYSLVHREPETDVLPACHALALAPVTWSPLGGGMLTGKYRKGEAGRLQAFGGKVFQAETSALRTATLDAVLGVAEDIHVTPEQVAIAWAAHRGALPIIGPRTMAQLTSNLGAATLALSTEHLARLDRASEAKKEMGESAAALDLSGLVPPAVPVA